MPNIELLTRHIMIAVALSAVISGTLKSVFARIERNFPNSKLTGNRKFLVTILISVLVSFGYTQYYAQLPTAESVAIFVLVALGPSAFYEVFLNSDKVDESTSTIDIDGNKIKLEVGEKGVQTNGK